MPICRWEGCKLVFEDAATFQEHVNKHIQQEMQQPKMDDQNNATADKGAVDGPSQIKNLNYKEPARRVKMDNNDGFGFGERNNNMVLAEEMAKSKIASISEDVWFDVLHFITRIHLARSVSFTSRLIHKVCGPRLHGNKVEAREIKKLAIKCRERFDWNAPATVLMLKDGKEVPFPTCPLPPYITGFREIKINFLDNHVWEFLKLITSSIADRKVVIIIKSKYFDEKRSSSVNQVVDMFRETFPQIYLNFYRPWERSSIGNIKYLLQMDNKMQRIYLPIEEEFEIPILMKILAIPRGDGKQRVMLLNLVFDVHDFALEQNTLDTIKQEFYASTECLPQPFYICFEHTTLNITTRIEDANPQTKETLVIMSTAGNGHLDICRHPTGDQREILPEDGRSRLREIEENELTTSISEETKSSPAFMPTLTQKSTEDKG